MALADTILIDLNDDTQKIAAYNVLVHSLPRANYFLIRALSAYLITVVNSSDVNKMGIRNVCIVFSPTLNIPSPVFGMFLSAFDAIFEQQKPSLDTSKIPALAITESSPDALTPENVRSPRKQLFSDIPTPLYNQPSFSHSKTHVAGDTALKSSGGHTSDTGFIPMQPAYDGPVGIPYHQTQEPGSVTVPGPEYAVSRPRNLGTGSNDKQSRRESSMLFMGSGPQTDILSTTQGGATGQFNEPNAYDRDGK